MEKNEHAPRDPKKELKLLKYSLGEVIAERTLELSQEGRKKKITVQIGKPIPDPYPDGDWVCTYRIEGLGSNKVLYVYGIDGVQALIFALQMVGVILESCRERDRLDITWLDSSDLGFPAHLPGSKSE